MGNVSADGKHLWLSGRFDDVVYASTRRAGGRRSTVGKEPHGLTVWPQPGRYSLGQPATCADAWRGRVAIDFPCNEPLAHPLRSASRSIRPRRRRESVADWAGLAARLEAPDAFDAALVDGDVTPATPIQLAAVAPLAPLVAVVDDPDAVTSGGWLRQGADEVLGREEVARGVLWRRLRFRSIERRPGAIGAGAAYATDPQNSACRIDSSSSST